MPGLPLELVQKIVEEIAAEAGYVRALRPLARACRDWAQMCQIKLFRAVTVEVDASGSENFALARIIYLAFSPRLATHVRVLDLVSSGSPEDDFRFLSWVPNVFVNTDSVSVRAVYGSISRIVQLVPRLRGLRSLSLSYTNFPTETNLLVSPHEWGGTRVQTVSLCMPVKKIFSVLSNMLETPMKDPLIRLRINVTEMGLFTFTRALPFFRSLGSLIVDVSSVNIGSWFRRVDELPSSVVQNLVQRLTFTQSSSLRRLTILVHTYTDRSGLRFLSALLAQAELPALHELVVKFCSLPAIDYSIFRPFDHPEWGPVECILSPRLAAGLNSCVVSLPAAYTEIDQADTFLRLLGLLERPGVLRIVPGRPEWDHTVTM